MTFMQEKLEHVTRVEVIDTRPATASNWSRAFVTGIDEDLRVVVSFQDDGRTLKVFLSKQPEGK